MKWLAWALLATGPCAAQELYDEALDITPLARNHLLMSFTFDLEAPRSTASHSNLMPRPLIKIFEQSKAESIKLRFTRGQWNQMQWGPLPRRGLYATGRGVELAASLSLSSPARDEVWQTLVNSLSGMFCTSLNYIDETRTIVTAQGFLGSLPGETVCTENLTPFLKLLPCKHSAGIAQLLRGHGLDDSEWSNLAVEVLGSGTDGRLQIRQVVDLVIDLERSLAVTTGSVPGSQPIEELVCVGDKHYTTDVTCLPVDTVRPRNVSLQSVFEHGSFRRCAAQHKDEIFVLDSPSGSAAARSIMSARHSTLPLKQEARIDGPQLFVQRSLMAQGSALQGRLSTTLTNARAHPISIRYRSIMPWYLRPFVNSIRSNNAVDFKVTHFSPAKDRRRPSHLEVDLTVPAGLTAVLTMDFEKSVLRYGEYPPDANRGFDIPAAIIYTDDGTELRTTNLLLPLPTPDFSMPYNVIILTSTVMALLFGGTFNLLLRNLGVETRQAAHHSSS